MKRPAVTPERIDHARRVVAGIVAARGGEAYAEIFDRLEREWAAYVQRQDAVSRARRLAGETMEREGRGA